MIYSNVSCGKVAFDLSHKINIETKELSNTEEDKMNTSVLKEYVKHLMD